MTLAQSFLQELIHESGNTRKMLQAMSDDVLDYKPSDKSWTMAQLASHIAETYHWYPLTLKNDLIDFSGYRYDKGDITKVENILAKFEANLKEAIAALEAVDNDGIFNDHYRLMMGEVEVGAMPRIAAVRSMLMNHLYHHRGQLSIFLRAAGKKVPGIYGPSGDEK
jgi:uncharacterized damage-inducible protein DinB